MAGADMDIRASGKRPPAHGPIEPLPERGRQSSPVRCRNDDIPYFDWPAKFVSTTLLRHLIGEVLKNLFENLAGSPIRGTSQERSIHHRQDSVSIASTDVSSPPKAPHLHFLCSCL